MTTKKAAVDLATLDIEEPKQAPDERVDPGNDTSAPIDARGADDAKVATAILAMMRKGDEDGAMKLMRRKWGSKLQAQAAVVAGEADAEDAVQETMIAVLSKLRDPDAQVTAVRAYVFKALSCQAINQRKAPWSRLMRSAAPPEDVEEPSPPSSQRPSNAPDAAEVAGRLIARLAPRERAILEWRNEGVAFREIGERLGISEGNARVIAVRATALLRRWWEKEYEEPKMRGA